MTERTEGFDFEGTRDFDRERVRREAEETFERGEARTYHRADVHDGGARRLPLAALLGDMANEGRRLLRAELRLARSELKVEAKKAGAGTGMVVAGATCGLIGAMALTACLIAALLPVMKLWVACLVVGIGLFALMGIFASAGIKAIKNVKPDKTIHSLKEDQQWASETLRAAKRQMHGHA